MNRILLLPLLLALAGCATPAKLNTASGRPEVTVDNRSIAHVRTTVVNSLVNQSWTPVKTEGSQLLFQKPGSAMQSFLMGLLTNEPNSTVQLSLTLVENAQNVRVIGGLSVIGQNTFGRQTAVEATGAYQQLQQLLENIKRKAEA
jgi:hypothetical protein